MKRSLFEPPLYLITDRKQAKGSLLETVQQALNGGVKGIQLREKDLPIRELLDLARALRALTAQNHASLMINHRVDVCLAVEADGVHLRADRLPIHTVRKILGDSKFIGVSVHSVEEVKRAEEEGADFVTLGPIYQTPSKVPYGPPLGLSVLQSACREVRIPVFALGGIQKNRIPEVRAAGAKGIALISAILAAKDPKKSAQALIKELTRSHP